MKAKNVTPVNLRDVERLKIELVALRRLERAIREMFAFTGWGDDRDPEPSMCVDRVEKALTEVENIRDGLL